MMFYLIKKDFVLIKRYLLLILALAFGIPLFFWWRLPVIMGFAVFMVTVFYTVYIPLQSVSLAETKYPKAISLLCTTPYTRSSIVKARYVFFLILFVFCYFAYAILSLLVPQIKMLSTFDAVLALLFFSIVSGIYFPLQYKLGYEKMKYALIIMLFATSFLLPSIVKMFSEAHIGVGIFNELPLPVCYVVLIAMTCVVAAISLTASIRIFQRKEL